MAPIFSGKSTESGTARVLGSGASGTQFFGVTRATKTTRLMRRRLDFLHEQA